MGKFKFVNFIYLSLNSQFPWSKIKFSTNFSVSWKMISYSRPKLSDLYTLSQTKLFENHTIHSNMYLLYGMYMAAPGNILAHKSSSKFFLSTKHELEIFYVFGGKVSERLGPSTGTGNEKRRTLRKSTPGVCTRKYSSHL